MSFAQRLLIAALVGATLAGCRACDAPPIPPVTNERLPEAEAGAPTLNVKVDAGPLAIACGAAKCRAPDELCCFEDHGPPHCVRKDGRPLFGVGLVGTYCTTQLAEQFIGSECEDSSACGAGRACCEHRGILTNPSFHQCDEARGRFACSDRERCTSAASCRTLDADCIEGVCVPRRKPRPLACGKATCKVGQTCCYDRVNGTFACGESADCGERGARFECLSAADCFPGESCTASDVGAHCTHFVFSLMCVACRTSADCGAPFDELCSAQHRATACVDAPHPPCSERMRMKTCTCR